MMIANYGQRAMPSLMGLAGSAEIIKLQQSLVNLAQATGHPEFNPNRTDGVMDDSTVAATAAAFSVAANEIPGWLSTALQLALIGGSATSAAKSYVSQYATQLSVAFNAAAIKYRKSPTAPVPTTPTMAATPWYGTWWGIGGLILVGIVGLKLVLGPRSAAQ